MPREPTWCILLQDPQNKTWDIVWNGSQGQVKQMVLYGMDKVLDGSDADAFMFIRRDHALKLLKELEYLHGCARTCEAM